MDFAAIRSLVRRAVGGAALARRWRIGVAGTGEISGGGTAVASVLEKRGAELETKGVFVWASRSFPLK
jgi:hypothetical protein